MRRVVSVWFPHWPTDRLRRRASTPTRGPSPEQPPLVTALHDGRRRVVAASDRAALALGLRPGMAMAQALALVPGLQVEEAEPDADADALQRLARWCHRYTPLAAACPPDGLWLDIAGCAHLFGPDGGDESAENEAALLRHLVGRLARDGIQARAAVADTPGAAHAVARHGPDPLSVVPPRGQSRAVAPLPVAALRLAPELEASLRRLGFEQVAHLARIPRPLLARRFGPLPGLRLDQAHGRAAEPLKPLAPERALHRRLPFVEPLLTTEALQVAIGHLVGPLCEEMERAGLGARRLDLLFERIDNQVEAIRIGTARPTRDAAHLMRLLAERLDTVDPGLGVEAMQLAVPLSEPLAWEQQQDGAEAAPAMARLVDRLSNRLGPDRVYCAAPVESDVPERSVRKAPPLETAPPRPEPRTGTEPPKPPRRMPSQPLAWRPRHDVKHAPHRPPDTWPARLLAPTRLLAPPRPISALAALPDQPPVAFTWRRRRHRILRADGPERIHGEWWRHESEMLAVRDYYLVENEEGQRFWLFREGDGLDPRSGALAWFLHGLF